MNRIEEVLAPLKRLAVLVSGGIDSEVLMHAAARFLGPANVLALTADTCFLADCYRMRIPEVCRKLGVKYAPVRWNPLESAEITANSPERCYHCKKAVYSRLTSEAFRMGFPLVADGTSMDDLGEERPGLRAAEEENVIHPFVAAGMGKDDVRAFGMELGVDNTDRPSDSCLATRVASGLELTAERLILAEKLEAPLIYLVRGRFRARLDSGGILLEYSEVDRALLEEHMSLIEETAAEAGLGVRLDLLHSDGM
jgi:uncharacterized protein